MSRNWDDLPPLASDEELLEWSKDLHNTPEFAPRVKAGRPSRPNRPLVATRVNSTMSTEELLVDISDRATEAYIRMRRRRVIVRR